MLILYFQNPSYCLPSGLQCYQKMLTNMTSSCLKSCEGIFADVDRDEKTPIAFEDYNLLLNLSSSWHNFEAQIVDNIEIALSEHDCITEKNFWCKLFMFQIY